MGKRVGGHQLTVGRRAAVFALGALVLLGLGVLIGRSIGGNEKAPARSPLNSEEGPGPTYVRNGVPLGYAATADGAVAAATNFAIVMSQIQTGDTAYVEAMSTLAAPEWRSEARGLAANTLEFLRSTYGDEADASFAPLRFRVLSHSESDASISVWGVLIIEEGEGNNRSQSWLTTTLQLLWLDDWRVIAAESSSGPTPDSSSASEGEAEEDLTGFQRYEDPALP